MQVNVYQDGKIYQQEYARGKVLYDLKGNRRDRARPARPSRFWPDVKNEDDPNGIFETGDFQYDVLQTRFTNGVPQPRHSHRLPRRTGSAEGRVFHYEGGIGEFVKFINKNKRFFCGADLHRRPRRRDGR